MNWDLLLVYLVYLGWNWNVNLRTSLRRRWCRRDLLTDLRFWYNSVEIILQMISLFELSFKMAISVARDTSLYFCRVVLFCLFLQLKMLVLLVFSFTLLKFPLTWRRPGGMWYWWSLSMMTKSTADFAVKLRHNNGKVDDYFRLPIFQYVRHNGDHWCCRDMHQWKYSLIRRRTMRHLFLAQNDSN